MMRTIAITFLLLFLSFGASLDPIYSKGSIAKYNFNASSISITSFIFNPSIAYSPWVDHVFGSKSIHHDYAMLDKLSSVQPVSVEDRIRRSQFVVNSTKFDSSRLGDCSIEMLGFARVGLEDPFLTKNKHGRPTLGTATLSYVGVNFTCWYRGMFENWRKESSNVQMHFWATFFFCPVPMGFACSTFIGRREKSPVLEAKLRMQLTKAIWSTTFRVRTLTENEINRRRATMRSPAAICTVIPYQSSDREKAAANGAMISEFIRYYNNLGMKVILYDRSGSYRREIMNRTDYKVSQGIPFPPNETDLAYYDDTIRGLLDPSTKGLRYDNTLLGQQTRTAMETTDNDKVYTFTQCRFEARAAFGIDVVVVADFDEFLYCPWGGPTASGQRQYVNDLISESLSNRVDQLVLSQRVTHNITANPRDCLVERLAAGDSILKCFTSYEFWAGGHSVKSIHLGLHCPLTGYHSSCPTLTPRSVDCYCNSRRIEAFHYNPKKPSKHRECAFVHLVTNSKQYEKVMRISAADRKRSFNSTSELWMVQHSSRNF